MLQNLKKTGDKNFLIAGRTMPLLLEPGEGGKFKTADNWDYDRLGSLIYGSALHMTHNNGVQFDIYIPISMEDAISCKKIGDIDLCESDIPDEYVNLPNEGSFDSVKGYAKLSFGNREEKIDLDADLGVYTEIMNNGMVREKSLKNIQEGMLKTSRIYQEGVAVFAQVISAFVEDVLGYNAIFIRQRNGIDCTKGILVQRYTDDDRVNNEACARMYEANIRN